ncbi:hypothetical protein CP335_04555 [Pseudomonas fluorescens]|uniref:Uncharacterized protein n=1 Tax=Pseudomonas fluorescens TaxID=294 RepID=A0A854X5E6_PSEFL|nr:hypothetical protein CP335_04555 [Pseudomonas fluorescens]
MGAGLLAKAVCQSTSVLNVRPHSRASPLSQGIAFTLTNPCCPSHATGRRPWSGRHPGGRS